MIAVMLPRDVAERLAQEIVTVYDAPIFCAAAKTALPTPIDWQPTTGGSTAYCNGRSAWTPDNKHYTIWPAYAGAEFRIVSSKVAAEDFLRNGFR